MVFEARIADMRNGQLHPGITIHKLPVGAGFAGLVFTLGSVAIFLIGLPELWYFVVGAIALGIGVAAGLRLVRH